MFCSGMDRAMKLKHAWMFACMHLHAWTDARQTDGWMYVRTYVRPYICMYICMYVCMNVHPRRTFIQELSMSIPEEPSDKHQWRGGASDLNARTFRGKNFSQGRVQDHAKAPDSMSLGSPQELPTRTCKRLWPRSSCQAPKRLTRASYMTCCCCCSGSQPQLFSTTLTSAHLVLTLLNSSQLFSPLATSSHFGSTHLTTFSAHLNSEQALTQRSSYTKKRLYKARPPRAPNKSIFTSTSKTWHLQDQHVQNLHARTL